MTTQLSKADKIRKLLHLSNAGVAKRVGCLEAYVRAVRQRTSESGHPIEDPSSKAWKDANPDRMRRYWRTSYDRMKADPEKYARRLAYVTKLKKKRYRSDPEFRRNMLDYQARRRAEARA